MGTIRLSVYARGITRSIKVFVIKSQAPYNAIIDTPWIHSMKVIPSTYHQCIKFSGKDVQIRTLQGDQQAARELLVATVKLQQSTSHVNTVSRLIHKIYPQEEEVLKVSLDDADPTKTVRVRAYLADELKDQIVSFLMNNIETFAWTTTYMKGKNLSITIHELNVDPTISQKKKESQPRVIEGSKQRTRSFSQGRVNR